MRGMSLIEPHHLPLLHTPAMNDTHYETVMHINRLGSALAAADPAAITESLDTLMAHTEAHYRAEEAQMLEKKFPPYPAHKEDHDNSLAQMRTAADAYRATQDLAALKTYIETDMVPWFLRHTETMDAVTSIFLENSEVHLPYWERLVPRNK